MSINFNNKRIPRIYQGSNLVYENASGDNGSTPQKTILIGNTNIARIMQGNELVWGEAYFPPVENPYARPNEVLLWYDFTRNTNESSDRGIIRDLSGNGNHGVLHNFNFSEESGYVENGLRFDGVDDYLTFNDMTFNPEDDFTIEIRMEEIVGTPGVDMNQQNSLYHRISIYSGDFSIWSSDSSNNITVRPRHSQENHLVFRRENTMAIGLNNGEHSQYASERVPRDWNIVRIYNSFGFRNNIFEGVISSIRIYKSALEDIEIKHNYYIDNGLNSVLTEETVNEVIPFMTEIIYDDTKEIGYEEVTQEGVNGEVDITYDVIRIDGEETYKVEKFRETISEVVNEIKVMGGTGRVVYGEGSTSIGLMAFEDAGITGDIEIADSVTKIGMYAFHRNQITSVVIPDSVTSIEGYAFRNNQLTSVVIPDSVISIGSQAFASNPLIEVSIAPHTEYNSSNTFPSSAVITVRD